MLLPEGASAQIAEHNPNAVPSSAVHHATVYSPTLKALLRPVHNERLGRGDDLVADVVVRTGEAGRQLVAALRGTAEPAAEEPSPVAKGFEAELEVLRALRNGHLPCRVEATSAGGAGLAGAQLVLAMLGRCAQEVVVLLADDASGLFAASLATVVDAARAAAGKATSVAGRQRQVQLVWALEGLALHGVDGDERALASCVPRAALAALYTSIAERGLPVLPRLADMPTSPVGHGIAKLGAELARQCGMTAATGDLLALALGRAIVGISLAEPEAALTMCAKAVADAYRAEMGKALATSDSRSARAHGKRAGPVVDDRGRDDEGEDGSSVDRTRGPASQRGDLSGGNAAGARQLARDRALEAAPLRLSSYPSLAAEARQHPLASMGFMEAASMLLAACAKLRSGVRGKYWTVVAHAIQDHLSVHVGSNHRELFTNALAFELRGDQVAYLMEPAQRDGDAAADKAGKQAGKGKSKTLPLVLLVDSVSDRVSGTRAAQSKTKRLPALCGDRGRPPLRRGWVSCRTLRPRTSTAK